MVTKGGFCSEEGNDIIDWLHKKLFLAMVGGVRLKAEEVPKRNCREGPVT